MDKKRRGIKTLLASPISREDLGRTEFNILDLYKHFSRVRAPTLLRILNEGRQSGSFFDGFNEGIVSLLYKKGSRHDVRNYRPVTLLNGDDKILTRMLAKRMLRIVTQFVSPEQIGFVPRTFIAETTMFI